MRRTGISAVGLFLVVASVGSGVATAARATAGACTGSMLSATFKAVPNSAGAGNVEYTLRLVDSSKGTCYVSGVPTGTLLDRQGGALPTHVAYAGPTMAMPSARITIAPGQAARVAVRFSPDVPGTGEPTNRACEKTAYKLRVTPTGGGTTVAPISPATAVCEKGSLFFLSSFTH